MYSPITATVAAAGNLPPTQQQHDRLASSTRPKAANEDGTWRPRSSRSVASTAAGSPNRPLPGWPPSHAFLMKAAVEDDDNESIFTTTSSLQKSIPDDQQRQRWRSPSWQRGPLLLSGLGAEEGEGRHDHHHHQYSPPFPLYANFAPMMPGLLTCREDNMSKLDISTYSSDDDSSYDDGTDKDARSTAAPHENQPSTGRTVAVSEFSNLAGMSGATAASVLPLKKAAMAGDTGDRTLQLVPSYSATSGHAGWSKFCLVASDGEQEDHGGDPDSPKQKWEDGQESPDSRTYSLTSDDDLVVSDGTDPPPLGARDDFGSGEIEFTPQETRAILRVVDRLNCGATALAKIAAFSLEDWMGEVCGPIIRDLEGSEIYRASGLDAQLRFGQHESIPPLKRYISSRLSPASPALLRDALPARVRRRAFLNTAAAMRGELEDPFFKVLGNGGKVSGGDGGDGGKETKDSISSTDGGPAQGLGGHNRNNFASVVARRLIEHGQAHYNVSAGPGRFSLPAPAYSALRDRPSNDDTDTDTDNDTDPRAVAAATAAHRRKRSQQRRPLRVDFDAVRAARPDRKSLGRVLGGGSGGGVPRGDGSGGGGDGGGYRSSEDDKDYYAGDSDSCSPRSGPPPTALLPKFESAGVLDVGDLHPPMADRKIERPSSTERPSATVAIAFTNDGDSSKTRITKEAPNPAGGRVGSGGTVGRASDRRGDRTAMLEAPASAMLAVEAAAAVVAATALTTSSIPNQRAAAAVSKIAEIGRDGHDSGKRCHTCADEAAVVAAAVTVPPRLKATEKTRTVAVGALPPAPRPAAAVGRRMGLELLSPPSSPEAPAASTASAASAAAAAAAAAAEAAAALPKAKIAAAAAAAAASAAAAVARIFSPDNARNNDAVAARKCVYAGDVGSRRSGPVVVAERNQKHSGNANGDGKTMMDMLETARESKPENTPESDETTTTSSVGCSRGGGVHKCGNHYSNHDNDDDGRGRFHKKGPRMPHKLADRGGQARGGTGGGSEGEELGSKRAFFGGSAGGTLPSRACDNGDDKGRVASDRRGEGRRGREAAGPAAAEPAAAESASVEPVLAAVDAPGVERGRLLYEHATRIGGAGRPKMSPVRVAHRRRPRIVYESLW